MRPFLLLAVLGAGSMWCAQPYAYITGSTSSTTEGGVVSVLNWKTNEIVDTITVGNGPAGIAIEPSGKFAYVANSNDNTVSVISLQANTVVKTIPVGKSPLKVLANPNGKFVYVLNNQVTNTSASASISVISVESDAVVHTISMPYSYSIDAVVSPNGKLLITSDGRIICTVSYSVLGQLAGGAPLAIGPDGRYVYDTELGNPDAAEPSFIDKVDLKTYEMVSQVQTALNSVGLVLTPDGHTLYSLEFLASEPFNLAALEGFSTESMTSVLNWETTSTNTSEASHFGFSPDGKLAYVVTDDDSNGSFFRAINTTTQSVVASASFSDYFYDSAATPDGKTVYLFDYRDNRIGILNAKTYDLTGTIQLYGGGLGFALAP